MPDDASPGEPSSSGQLGHFDRQPSRRRLLASAALGGGSAWAASLPLALPATAAKSVTLRDGTVVDAFEHSQSLSIVALRGSVPSQWITDYRSALGQYAGFSLDQRAQIDEIFRDLSDLNKKRSAGLADVVTLGDAWLGPAIARGLLAPIPGAEGARWWRRLPRRWQRLARRNAHGFPDERGEIYAAPYRWGTTLVAYKPDRVLHHGGTPIVTWADLLQPRLKGRVAFLDSSRELLGVALKTLGLGFNASAAEVAAAGVTPAALRERLQRLRAQVLLFSSRDHVRAFSAGDAWAVVGWSDDLVKLGERSGSTQVVVPRDGTALWADLWAVPTNAKGGHLQQGPSPTLTSWLEFGLQPGRIASLQTLRTGVSPLLLPPAQPRGAAAAVAKAAAGKAAAAAKVAHAAGAGGSASGSAAAEVELSPDQLRLGGSNPWLPPDQVLRRSEFLLPLDDDTLALYSQALQL